MAHQRRLSSRQRGEHAGLLLWMLSQMDGAPLLHGLALCAEHCVGRSDGLSPNGCGALCCKQHHPLPARRSSGLKVSLNLLIRRVISVTSDDIFTLHESDAIKWRREEALASVSATLFLDLPAPSPELAAQSRAAAPTLSERVQAEFLSLKARAAAPVSSVLRLPGADDYLPTSLPPSGACTSKVDAANYTCATAAAQTSCSCCLCMIRWQLQSRRAVECCGHIL